MNKIRRYAYIEVQTSLFIGQARNLIEYRFTSYSKKKKKSFLFEYSQNQRFRKQSGNSFITNIVPVEFDEISDIAETGVTFQFFYNGKVIHTQTHCPLFAEKPKQPSIIKLKQSQVQTVKNWEAEQKKQVVIPRKKRKLTENERKMLRGIFTNPKFPLDMDKITIYENNFFNVDRAVTPWGDINFPPAPVLSKGIEDGKYHHFYMEDFTLPSQNGKIPPNPSLLVHEVTHAWQYQYAGTVFTSAALGCQILNTAGIDPYKYYLSREKIPNPDILKMFSPKGSPSNRNLFMSISPYNPEALASIVEDYYYRFLRHDANGKKVPDMGTRYPKNQHNNNKNINDYIMVLRGYVLA